MPLAISHEKSEIELHLEIVAPAELAATQTVRINDSRVLSNQQTIYLTGEDSAQIRDLIKEIYQCEEIHLRHRAEAAEKEVADFVRAQGQRADTLKRDLDTALQNAFMKGSFVFRAKPHAVSTRGDELLAACKLQVQHVAAEVFYRFKEAPENVETNLADLLPSVENRPNTDRRTIADSGGVIRWRWPLSFPGIGIERRVPQRH